MLHRTCLRIWTRLQNRHGLRLAVYVYRNTITTIDVTEQSMNGLGRHYHLVGVYDSSSTHEQIAEDCNDCMKELRK